ncbi:SseB family protein [Mycolicibacter heraklionensis]|uniref:SseB family protein n=1 Tax=Mycolicibacter heraklionensis TaxID=512402 RepID=UPI002AB0ACE9|nr:SseB family protein [Mycolicibacter heraklionensis]
MLHQPHGEAPLVIGETTDGKPKTFLLERDGVQYFPVFRSAESMKEFYEQRNRAAYLVIEGDIKAVMDTISSIELMKDVRIVIDPMGEHPVEIMPDA